MPCTCHFLAASASSFSLDNNFKYTHHAFISHTWTFLPTDLHMPNGPSRAPYSTISFNCAPWTTGLFLHTPWKISMEPENTPLEKEKHLHITNFAWFHVGFQGYLHAPFASAKLPQHLQWSTWAFFSCPAAALRFARLLLLKSSCVVYKDPVARNKGIYIPAKQHVPTQDHPRYVWSSFPFPKVGYVSSL